MKVFLCILVKIASNIQFSIQKKKKKKKKFTLNYPQSAAMEFFEGTQNEFETAVVNEPSVFERPK